MFKVIPILTQDLKGTKDADILEIWFEKPAFTKPTIAKPAFAKKINKPIIYKSESPSKNLQEEAVKLSTYIDLDIETPTRVIKKIKRINPEIKLIISYHNFKETPYQKDLQKLQKKILKKKPDIIKFATHAKAIVDSFRMLDFLAEISKKEQKAICICMGEHGLLTRIAGHMFGNQMMYFSRTKSKSSKTALGQITIKEFNEYNHES
ncbi:type I 3-dehydroquinate dehydratase [Candidatus Peregrinibacteria bacterium]|jgi:3-dehydroquinate dehydratase type I|nr:type I 3-dehydroquinate dehydratase [Candidatus Peregrinibacteria bacterium]MBT4147981.1 type I 3-dehydroquinate dehydratase [Candidatus Peregrinibacteria bacterium]MBT4366112.1 type I 3-dehydroquinate dehydratase [Candidatus Peregrinibacteria bacterium]MBT4456230.1 type I 3-dehydroquinate dehydratase [Candidatus Peregrinibacteria bacterium]